MCPENIKEETQYDEEDSGDDAGNGVNSGICGLPRPRTHPAPSPSPAAVATPAASPVVSPEVTNNAEVGPNTQGNTDGVIEGFKEGEVVDADKLPDKVKTAIKEKYPEATIKTVTFATYENQQLYKILLQKTENDTTEEVYVTANGAIIPARLPPQQLPASLPQAQRLPQRKSNAIKKRPRAAYFFANLGRIAKTQQKNTADGKFPTNSGIINKNAPGGL